MTLRRKWLFLSSTNKGIKSVLALGNVLKGFKECDKSFVRMNRMYVTRLNIEPKVFSAPLV